MLALLEQSPISLKDNKHKDNKAKIEENSKRQPLVLVFTLDIFMFLRFKLVGVSVKFLFFKPLEGNPSKWLSIWKANYLNVSAKVLVQQILVFLVRFESTLNVATSRPSHRVIQVYPGLSRSWDSIAFKVSEHNFELALH